MRFQLFGLAIGSMLVLLGLYFLTVMLLGNKDAFWLGLIFIATGVGFLLWALPLAQEGLPQLAPHWGKLIMASPATIIFFAWAIFWPREAMAYRLIVGGLGIITTFLWVVPPLWREWKRFLRYLAKLDQAAYRKDFPNSSNQ